MSANELFDCIVIGFGGVGSAALREAAKRGWKVLGLDRFGPAHDRGSSHGQTRIIRRAYFEHPSYVPLACRAFEMWDELNKRHRTSIDIKQLITTCGLLQVGLPDSEVIVGVRESARQHGIAIEEFTAEEIERRLPIFNVPQDMIGLYEPDAAFLRVELCVAAAVNQALVHGAEIKANVVVDRWSQRTDGNFEVVTDSGTYSGRRLIICAGAWAQSLLPEVNLGLRVLQKQQQWFQLDRVDQKLVNQFPAFLFELESGDCYYGLPEIDYLGLKVAEHSGGTELHDPSEIANGLNQAEFERVESFMNNHMRFGRSRMVHHSQCMYSMSADSHFLVDLHPQHDRVALAAGLSGHGFKFAPVIGKYLVDLLEGQREQEFEFLRLDQRLGLKEGNQ